MECAQIRYLLRFLCTTLCCTGTRRVQSRELAILTETSRRGKIPLVPGVCFTKVMLNMIAAFLEKYRALVLLFTGGLVVTAGDPVMKKWILNGGYVNYLVGLAIWTVGLNFLAFSFSSKNMASASVIFIIFNVITLTLVGYFAFRERLKTKEILGIVLGLISIFILEMAE